MTKRQLLEKLAGVPDDAIVTVCHRDQHLAPHHGFSRNITKDTPHDDISGDAIDAKVVPGHNRIAIVY